MLATFGPDMSFAAAAMIITSSVPGSYQGTAGSLLVTVQNLTVAVMTSISGAIGTKVDALPEGDIGLAGIKAIWWFGLASALLGALITATLVRIPRVEEKDQVQLLLLFDDNGHDLREASHSLCRFSASSLSYCTSIIAHNHVNLRPVSSTLRSQVCLPLTTLSHLSR